MQGFRACLMAAAFVASASAVQAATITGVSPQGEVAQLRQITVKFSEAVVPFGDLRLPDPMSLACEGAVPKGAGRWANDRVWLYDFSEAPGPGTRCTLKARSDWKPSGGALTGNTDYRFSTGGPALVSMQPYDGGQIEEDQVFLLRLNGGAVPATVVANVWCEVEGIGERIGVRIIDGEPRAQLLKARKLIKAQAELTLMLACQRPLPNASAVRLVWGKGVAAAANPKVMTSIEQRYRFTVRPAFTAEFSCERERANAPCLPIRPMSLRFSAPVSRELAAQVRLKPASGDSYKPVFDKDDKASEVTDITFPKPLPESAAFTVELPREVKDNAGRVLSNAALFPLKVATGDAPPIAKFAAAPFGVIELADPVLPLTLRHVQGDLRPAAAGGQVRTRRLQTDAEILAWLARLRKYNDGQLSAQEAGLPERDWYEFTEITNALGRKVKQRSERYVATRELSLLKQDSAARRLDLPQLAGGDPRPFEVVGIPLPEPGYHVVEIESARLGESLLDKRAPMFVRTGVLVTNLGVHFKLGRENSLVWVTTLDRGKPVAGADVVINDCFGKKLWAGQTDAQGVARAAQAFDARFEGCPAEDGLFVTARKADAKGVVDTAFVFSNWQKGIEAWRFNLPTGHGSEPDVRAATVFDRTLFRAGETVAMKHFARFETSSGLASLKPDELPTRMKIVHEGTDQEFTQPLQWNGVRNAASSWNIPPAAKLGVYNVMLERESGAESRRRQWTSGNFRVEEFRLPLVDARLSGPKSVAVAPKALPLELQLNFFSGGPMAQAPVRASALLKSRPATFAGFDEFSFEPPRDPAKAQESSDENEPVAGSDGKLVADKLPLSTDKNGAASFTLKDLPKITRPSEITAEVSYNDPNGEVQTIASSIRLWPSAVVLGVKAGSWASSRGKVKFSVVALDTQGAVLKGQSVEVRGRLSQTISTRKRLVGGFYAYDNRTEVKDIGRDRKSTRLNSSHGGISRMPSSA